MTNESSSRQRPIFVVGVPRSGTTLLSAMLSSHSRLSCGPETSFFAALAKRSTDELLREDGWPSRAVDFLYSIHLGGEPVPDRFEIDRQEITDYLSGRSPTVSAILESLTDQLRLAEGKDRWIEKSPIHLLHTRTIRHHFPTAPIVRIVRDARDVALSLLEVPWGPDSLSSALLYWRRFEHQSARFFANSSHHTWSLRYEDLVRDPEEQLRRICRYVGEEYEPSMLDFANRSAGLRKDNETWKGNVGKSLDSSRVEVWRRTLTESQQRLAAALTADCLRIYDYPIPEREQAQDHLLWLRPMTEDIEGYEATLEELIESGARCWRSSRFESPQVVALLGHPEEDGWLGRGRVARLVQSLKIGWTLAVAKMTSRRIVWKVRQEPTASQGMCEGALRSILAFLEIDPALEHPPSESGEESEEGTRRALQ